MKTISRILPVLLALILCLLLQPAAWADGGVAVDAAHFPDETFRTWVSENCDTNADGSLSAGEIASVTRIDVGVYNDDQRGEITSLKGIEYFTALESLDCAKNQLTALDVSRNTALTQLYCQDNQLTALDVSRNTALTDLLCDGNQLTALDISHNPDLEMLLCHVNDLRVLDISGNAQLKATVTDGTLRFESGIVRFDRAVEIDNPEYPDVIEYSLYYDLGVELITGLPAADTGLAIDAVNFPDNAFRSYVNVFDVDSDGRLNDRELAAVAEIDVAGESMDQRGAITSLKGIEHFPELGYLYCFYNEIASLDLSANTKLIYVDCGGNRLTELDVSHNTALMGLLCGKNGLTSLELSKNTALMGLDCERNSLTSLDLSHNTALHGVACAGNELTALTLGQNQNLSYIECGIMTNDGIIYGNKLTQLDVSGCPALEELWCGYNELSSLELSNHAELRCLYCYNNKLTNLNLSGCENLIEISCGNNLLNVLDVSGLTALENLYCFNNRLTSLDVSGCTALHLLRCQENLLTALDVSQNPELRALYCYANQLTALDVSRNTALAYLQFADNQLTTIDVSHNPALLGLAAHHNQIKTLDISPCPELVALMERVEAQEEDGIIVYEEVTDRNLWLLYDEGVTLGLPEPDLILPANLALIESSAFEGGAFRYVVIPSGAEKIESGAFAACPNLRYADFMGTDTVIEDGAFGAAAGLTIIGFPGSSAEAYAEDNGFTFVPAA